MVNSQFCATIKPMASQNKLVIVIPALNEEPTIAHVITSIPRQISEISACEVIVVDDGSIDQTSTLARAGGAHVVRHAQPMGVGAAIQTGFREALARGADIIVNIDADGQFNAADIPKLIAPILQGKTELVTCSRFADPRLTPEMPAIKKWGNRWMTLIINVITGKRFTDVSCGFRAYSRDAALRLILFGRFTYTQETFIDLAFKGISMTEVPLKVRGVRQHGRSRVADNLWRYGLKSASIIFRSARDFRPLIFFGIPGLAVTAAGLLSGGFLVWHWLLTGQTSPYRSLVQISGIFIIVGVLLGFMAMLADMQHRNRILIEEVVYLTRKKFYDRGR